MSLWEAEITCQVQTANTMRAHVGLWDTRQDFQTAPVYLYLQLHLYTATFSYTSACSNTCTCSYTFYYHYTCNFSYTCKPILLYLQLHLYLCVLSVQDEVTCAVDSVSGASCRREPPRK